MTVTALLVSHDGARWLPAVLAGLERQTVLPDRLVAVDTGSSDDSTALLTAALGTDAVHPAPSRSSYDDAVKIGLSHLDGALGGAAARPDPREPEWIWLLHDDSAPATDALERLLAAATANPSATILGPKLREWPSLRRLLEVGATISGTGRRETGLERGEYDQGQHDRIRDVLAVNTAGMLVRRDVFEELGGFDRRLPIFGNDLDFGWRAARAGHRTIVVPAAVVFHVEAAHRGVRQTPLTTRRFRREERAAALYTILVNCSLIALPVQVVRLLLGSLVRIGGLLLVRAPGEAFDELVALARTYVRPDRIIAGRFARRTTARRSPRETRHLLAPVWVPYRHGLDFVSDIAVAVASQGREVAAARRPLRAHTAETGPVPDEAENLPADDGLIVRLVTSPVALVFALLVLLGAWSARDVLGAGMLSGGSLLPAPTTAAHWWNLYLESHHEAGTGSTVPAQPFVLPLALIGTLLLGKAWLVVDLLFFFAVPLAAWGGYRFFRSVTGSWSASVWPALWGAVVYGLLPVLSGAVNQGRVGTVAAAVLLPLVARSAVGLAPGNDRDRRWRAAWRTSLALAVLAAFVPLAWLLAVALAVPAVLLGLVSGRAGGRRFGTWSPVLVVLVAVPVLLLPWSFQVFTDGAGAAVLLLEAGVASAVPAGLDGWDLVFGRLAPTGSGPGWVGAVIVLAALASLLRTDTRTRVLGPWAVLVVTLLMLAATADLRVPLDGLAGDAFASSGLLVLVVHAAAIWAAVIAANGISAEFGSASFGWRQPVAAVVVGFSVVAPVAGLVWWAATGVSDPVDRQRADVVPTYMSELAVAGADSGVLVLRGDRSSGIEYSVLRGRGLRLGDGSVSAATPPDPELGEIVGALVSAPAADDVQRLSTFGVEYIFAAPPADPELAAGLDSTSGLSQASSLRPGSAAWQLDADPDRSSLAAPAESRRPWLLAAQFAAILGCLVLAAPSRRDLR